MKHCTTNTLAKRRAVAAMEAALVLPALLLFMGAIVDLGRLGQVADSVSTGARNASQFGSASTTTTTETAQMTAAVLTEMTNLPNVSGTNPTVTASTVTHSGSQFVHTTVTYNTSGVQLLGLFPVTNLTRSVEFPLMPSR